jgi:hypothetical protein
MTSHTVEYTPDRTDRILLGSCVAVWLAALGAGVAATVALVDLGHGRTASTDDSGTPWGLYVVIGVSAAVIAAAVPLLLRVRRDAQQGAATAPRAPEGAAEPSTPPRVGEAPTEKIRVATPPAAGLRTPAATHSPVIDQLWVRCAASIACAMGVATLLIGVSSYLMAVDTDVAAWVTYGVAGVVTVAMAAIPWYFLRELRAHTEG